MAPRAGFEGLTTSPSGDSLYVLLQSAPVQDGGPNKATNRYTRFLKYDVDNLNNIKLKEEYIVPLPQSSKGNTLAQSELLWLNDHQFLVLARDGTGAGDSDTGSKYKCVSRPPSGVPALRTATLTCSATPQVGRSDRHLSRDEHRRIQVRLTRPPRRARGGAGRQHHADRVPAVRAVHQRDAARALRAAQRRRGRRDADRLQVGDARARAGGR